jgi:UDP-glucose 4-epimerase
LSSAIFAFTAEDKSDYKNIFAKVNTVTKALVVGGNGFIGSHLVDKLVDDGWEVVVLDLFDRRYDYCPSQVRFIRGDLDQSYLLRESLIGVDVVFHLAWSGIHEVANQEPVAGIISNLLPTIKLFDNCLQANIKRLVFISSGGTVYGPATILPIPETHPKNPLNLYGVNKLMVEKYLQVYNNLYGLDYAVVRPSVPYGPRQNPQSRQGAVAVFLYRVAKHIPITIWGDGNITRDYFYILDLVDALVSCAERPTLKDRIFNIGGGSEISLNTLLHKVEVTIGKKGIVEYQEPRKFDAHRILLDIQHAKSELNWTPKVSLDQGIEQTWQWMSTII